ncbi:hypothetical protein Tco_0041063 [Tanacetum coccineum]
MELKDISVGLILNDLTKDFVGFVRNYNTHKIGKTIGELHALLIEYEKGLPKKAPTSQVLAIQGGRIHIPTRNCKQLRGRVKQKVRARIIIMEYLVNISKRRAFWSLNKDILKITILTTNTPYPSRKIWRIRAYTHQRPQRKQVQYAISSEDQYAVLEVRHFKTLHLDELRSPDFNLFSDQEYSEEEVAETMAETMEQYMSKTRADYGSGVARPKIEDKDNFELKGQFLKELRTNTFSSSDHEDANKHIEKVFEIVDLFLIPNITIDQVMLRAFPMSLTVAASRWLRNEPTGSIKLGMQEPDENLYQAWERFKELLMKYHQYYLTEMQEVILFYNGLGIPTRQILDSRGAIPLKTVADAKVVIQEMAEYSQKWHNGTSRSRTTKTSNGLAAIQAQLNNLGREIKKVNEKVYAAQVGCKQ